MQGSVEAVTIGHGLLVPFRQPTSMFTGELCRNGLTADINQNEYCIASWDSYVNLYERTKQNKTNLQTSKQTNEQTKKGGNRF